MSFGRPVTAAQLAYRFALAAGVALACAAGAAAQPPADQPDDTAPLPPQDAKRFDDLKWRPKGGAFRIDGDKAIFKGRYDPKTKAVTGGVEDDRPVASEKQNADEAAAWAEVVLHADQFAAADLEKHAAADLTADDLTYPIRRYFRLELVRFDGTLTRARRVAPTKSVAERGGPAALYEGWLVPVGEPPANAVRVVFTAWPAGLPAPPAPAAGDQAGAWVEVNRWVTFAGYFFKLATDPDGSHKAPLLVGKSVTPRAGPPAEATDPALATRYRVFRLVRDDAPVSRDPAHWEEGAAWTRAVLHARRFDTARLVEAARADLSFADLFRTGREDYQFQLVQVRGRLIRVKQMEVGKRLADAGVPALYEAWVVPHDEPRGNPICVVLTELPEGVEPAPLMNRTVTVAGYFFKLFQYESAEASAEDPSRNRWKRAPLLIGRGVVLAADVENGPDVWIRWFIPVIVGGILLMALTAFLLSRWFRAGDRRARAEFEAARVTNPFTD